jgi:hypothetical protein
MNVPGFTAEASLNKTNGKYANRRCSFGNAAVGEMASQITPCKNCPDELPVPCPGEQNCRCCKYGCDYTPGGVAICAEKPKGDVILGGSRGFPVLDGILT